MAGGVLRGAGKQAIGALCNLVGYYFIGFPIGASLMFAANMGIEGKITPFVFNSEMNAVRSLICCLSVNVQEDHLNSSLLCVKGLWTGLTICVLMQAVFFVTYLSKLDWKKAADEVRTVPTPLNQFKVGINEVLIHSECIPTLDGSQHTPSVTDYGNGRPVPK